MVSAWPLVLALYEKFPDNVPMIKEILVDVESYLVRRMVCGVSTRNYRKFFSKLVGVVKENNDDINIAIRKRLLHSETKIDRFPTDGEFESSWNNKEIYSELTVKRVRMLLEAMEQELHTQYTEKVLIPKNLSIEHIMPEKWHKNWSDANVNQEKRDLIIHTIGNLTLVKGKFNSAQSNRGWCSTPTTKVGKREQLKEHSVLMMNKLITKEKNWTETEIQNRSEVLFEKARKLWFRPQSMKKM